MPDRRARHGAWALASLLIISLAISATFAVRAAESGPSPRFVRGPFVLGPMASEGSTPLGGGLHIAGSGACLPLVRELASRFGAAHPGIRIVVHESIGSTGGVRAVHERAVAIGCVSRPLSDREGTLGLEVLPFARVPVVMIAHPDVVDTTLSRRDLVATFAGERDRWSDGAPRIVLMRERGDSAQAAIARALPELVPVIHRALAAERFRVLYHDDDLVRSVAQAPGAIGVSDLVQAARGRVRVLAIDGVIPSPATLRNGSYPFSRDLALVLRVDAPELARALATFARSEEVAAHLEAAGAVALGTGAP